ncbi:sigma-54-dependent Fis family transcriptional regulator [Kyrpidia spormannii]|uniref:sigma-54-dependent Fis family transcriptional regulator n=1 Tax=Kyrpidia spormannii TaxID=2055160 RepID=UPI001E3AAA31|nr:sigma-54-dependent Fis family transcriptional regulator [Kyrpidia spormannii]
MYHAHRTVLSPEELRKQRRRLEESWDHFLRDPRTAGSSSIRSVVLESWSRCVQSGVDPRRKATDISLKEDQIKDILQYSQLYELSFPVLQDLSLQVKETGYLVTLCDPKGHILFLDGDHQVLKKAERMNFVVGADWSEQSIGTNAIGTCLEVGQPVQIFAAEHFCVGVQDWTCSSAPIRDPISREIIGVVDVTGLWRDIQPHTLSMVTMACGTIQSRMNQQIAGARFELSERYQRAHQRYPGNGVMALDAAFHPVAVNEEARQILRRHSGREVEQWWDNERIHAALFAARSPSGDEGMYEVTLEECGIRVVVEEVQWSGRRVGYLLILRPMGSQKAAGPTVAWGGVIGRSPEILSVISRCDVVAHTDVPVLLLGESGTGKELFARGIHQAGPRRNGPFIAVNCGALQKDLLASELFGYAPGAFTGASKTGKPGKFEEAQNGTLFLDEIGEMPPEFQVHLLRVLQEREVVRLGSSQPIPVNARIIAATHRNLEEMIRRGEFREDLYFRLHVVSLTIPPLRDRRGDIPLLIDHILDQLSKRYHIPRPGLEPDVFDFFAHRYPWPGNVRELKHALEYAVLFCNRVITWRDLPETLRKAGLGDSDRPLAPKNADPPVTSGDHRLAVGRSTLASPRQSLPGPVKSAPVSRLEPDPDVANAEPGGTGADREQLLQLLEEVGGNLSEAARRLRIARTTLYRRLDRYGIRKRLKIE